MKLIRFSGKCKRADLQVLQWVGPKFQASYICTYSPYFFPLDLKATMWHFNEWDQNFKQITFVHIHHIFFPLALKATMWSFCLSTGVSWNDLRETHTHTTHTTHTHTQNLVTVNQLNSLLLLTDQSCCPLFSPTMIPSVDAKSEEGKCSISYSTLQRI